MQDNNQNNSNIRRNNGNRNAASPNSANRAVRQPSGGSSDRPRQAVRQNPNGTRQSSAAQGNTGARPRTPASGQPRQGQPRQGQPRPSQGQRPQGARPQNPNTAKKRTTPAKGKAGKRKKQNLTPKQAARKKRNKILLFIAEIFVLLLLLVVFWGISKANKIKVVTIDDNEVEISEQVKEATETGVMKGYRNIALFGVDSREGELDKSTRTDTIMIASINLDTKEVKLISVYRDTWLNLSTDTYSKANAAYAKGGPKQAISMLNMNLDMNITDFVTIGFDGLIDVIDAVGGVEIDVKEAEIVHLNSFQISMAGEPDGTLNEAGEPNYTATEGVDYIPVTRSGLQTLNGLQATAYCRIRYVGNDFERTQRQRTVLSQVAKKAITLNPATLNNIAEAVFPKIATSLDLSEILSLLSGLASYNIGESSGFPFDDCITTGRVGSASVVIPVDLEKNVIKLHEFFFNETDYTPSETVKKCSQKIAADTGVSASQ